MKRVHPNIPTQEIPCVANSNSCSDTKQGTGVEVLMVWRKSLLFNCSGFTVFNSDGNLAFRVDSYSSRNCGEIVLMGGAGKPLFTSRRKKMSLSFGEQWLVYDCEGSAFPRFAVNKYRSLRHTKTLAKVTRCSAFLNWTYEIEGSYAKRRCVVYGEGRRRLAEIRQKEAAANGSGFGADVFWLVVNQRMDTTVCKSDGGERVQKLNSLPPTETPSLRLAGYEVE